MAEEIVKQNSIDLEFALKRGTVVIADLASATVGRFVARRTGESTFQIDISETPPATKILVDDPVTGTVKVKLDSDDTDVDLGVYDIALQMTYSATRKEEFVLKKEIEIIEQLITT